jgi:hypothetical protein
VRTAAFYLLALLALVGCNPAPTYLEAHGHFGDGTLIDFDQSATLLVGTDPQTGAPITYVRSVDTSGPPFMGMVVQVDLGLITGPGQYPTTKDGTGGAQIRVLVPGADFLDTIEYTANGTLDVLELPIAGNDRFAGSFSSVVVDYDGLDITVEQGTFRGQL